MIATVEKVSKIFKSRLLAFGCNYLIGIVAILVLIGWVFDLNALKSISPTFTTMKVSAALMFVMSAVMNHTMLTWKKQLSDIRAGVMGTMMMSLLIFSLLMIMDLLTKEKMGFTEILKEDSGTIFTVKGGAPCIMTVLLFLVHSFTGLCYIFNTDKMPKRLIRFATITLLTAVIAIVGYVLWIPTMFYYIKHYSSAMALHSAILFILNSYIVMTIANDYTNHNEHSNNVSL